MNTSPGAVDPTRQRIGVLTMWFYCQDTGIHLWYVHVLEQTWVHAYTIYRYNMVCAAYRLHPLQPWPHKPTVLLSTYFDPVSPAPSYNYYSLCLIKTNGQPTNLNDLPFCKMYFSQNEQVTSVAILLLIKRGSKSFHICSGNFSNIFRTYLFG